MDLNTGTPIQQPSTQVPPIPQASPPLPTFVKQDLPATIPPVVDPDMSQTTEVETPIAPETGDIGDLVPPVSSTPDKVDDEELEHTPAFMDTLAALKKIASDTVKPNGEAPIPIAKEPTADLPIVDEPVNVPTPVQPPTPQVAADPAMQDQTQVSPSLSTPTVMSPTSESLSPTIKQDTANPLATEIPVAVIEVPGPYKMIELLDLVVQRNASDLHLVVGYTPMLRVDGDLVAVGHMILDPKMAKELIYSILPDDKKEQLEVNREVDLAYQHRDLGRFRINAYWQRGYISGAFRLIPTRIRSIDELKLPDLFHKFADMEQGLILVTGPTGHGKSTTLASVIQEINMKYPKHILTIEDPVEYVFPQQKALVSQRELGDDTHSWKGALRSALREDPDVVLVGEMRDLETISAAITVAETGHLVFATLHTNSAAQTVQRIVNMYPDVQQEEIRSELADVLEAVVAQRLIPIKGGGRRVALEIMLMTPAIRNLIRENKIYQIDNIIRTSMDIGMVTLEKSLMTLYREGLLSQEDAMRYALDATEMARLLEELV